MPLERTFAGLEARLRPRGAGRFVSAGFLGFWLCGWLVGEVAVAGLFIAGAWRVLTGQEIISDGQPISAAGTLMIGGFMVLWLALWTVGGIAALWELLRLLWAEDHVVISPDRLRVVRCLGLSRKTWDFPRAELRSIYRTSANHLMVVHGGDSRELTRLGTVEERAELEAALRQELDLAEPRGDLPPLLPSDWDEVRLANGTKAVTRRVSTRRGQARVMWVLAAVAFCGVVLCVRDREPRGFLLLFALSAALLTWGAVWLSWGRREWRAGTRELALVSRFRGRERITFVAHGLELEQSRDSDGDEWYKLVALGRAPGHERVRRRTIISVMHDPCEPRLLGQWLAAHCGLPVIATSR